MKKMILLLVFMAVCSIGCASAESGTSTDSSAEISINGLEIGEKATKKMMDNLVMDASFMHEYKNVGFNVDEDDRIDYLSYFATFNLSGDNLEFDDAVIVYKDTTFESFEQMVSYFEESGNAEYSKEGGEILYYEDESCTVAVYFYDESFSGIVIEEK